jgi:hypothetical protein
MRRPAAFFPIVLTLGAITLVPVVSTRAQDAREEGPFEIEKCQTISKSGSYKLVKNISPTSSTSTNGTCLVITASFVSINLGGFTITGFGGTGTFGVVAVPSSGRLQGIAVRNGSIVGNGVDLSAADGSIVEGLGVFGVPPTDVGIDAAGIVKNNTVVGIVAQHGFGIGISASGTVTGNYVTGSGNGMSIVQGSTVLGNTSTNNGSPQGNPAQGIGISVECPSNVTDNTAVNNGTVNLVLSGTGCNDTNNVAP